MWRIRKAFPEARVTLLSNSDVKNPHYVSARSVLPPSGLYDDWLAYPANIPFKEKPSVFARLASEIRRRRFDAVIYLMNRNRPAAHILRDEMFFRFAAAGRIIGVKHLKENRLGSDLRKVSRAVGAESDFLLDCLSADSFPQTNDSPLFDLLLSDAEIEAARNWLRSNCAGLVPGRTLVAVAPASKWASKVWNEERYAEVVERLISQKGIFPVVFGGPEDREKGDRLLTRWQTGANAAGELGVRHAAAALSQCGLYLGNDTGTMHLAAAVGVPCVAIFAAVDLPNRWYPAGTRNQVFRKSVECEGCNTPHCFNQHKCLELVETVEVYDACIKVLDEASPHFG